LRLRDRACDVVKALKDADAASTVVVFTGCGSIRPG
jgi:hypothetical protein